MPIVNIAGVGEVTFPDSWSHEQIVNAIETDIIPKHQAELAKPVSKLESLKGGAKRMLGSMETGVAGMFGAEEAAKAGQARQEAITERSGTDLEKVKQAYHDKGLWAAGKEVAGQIPNAIAEQLPNLATTIAGARTGAMLGALGGPFSEVTVPLGALAGAFAPSYIQQAGSNLERQAQEGAPISGTAAYGAAAPQAALDVFTDKLLFSRLLGMPVKKLGTVEAERIAKQSLMKTLRSGTAKGIYAEVPTEVTQQALERYQAGLSLTDDDARKEYAATAYQTALLGPLGAIGSVQERGEARQITAEHQAEQERQAQAAQAQAQREATGVMDQQPLFTPEEAPIVEQPEVAGPPATPIPEPTTTMPTEFGFNEKGEYVETPKPVQDVTYDKRGNPVYPATTPEAVPVGQGDLFTARGKPSPEALASVETARLQGLPSQIQEMNQTPEGRKELAANMKMYFPELDTIERNKLRNQIKAGTYGVEPTPAPVVPEGTLTPDVLKSFGITKRNKEQFKALANSNIANPMTRQYLITAAERGDEQGIRANRIIDAYQLAGAKNEQKQQALSDVQKNRISNNVKPAGTEQGVGMPVQPTEAPVEETKELDGTGMGLPVGPADGRTDLAGQGVAEQPSALTAKELKAQEREQKRITKEQAKAQRLALEAQAKEQERANTELKKEPVATTWSYMSDTPYAKLSKEAKRKVKEAHDQDYLTQEIADRIDAIERRNARATKTGQAIKPETLLEETVEKPAKIKDLTVTQDYLEEELTRRYGIRNRLNNVIAPDTLKAIIRSAVDKWESDARSGAHGVYDAGEIEATKAHMLDSPTDYSDMLNLPTEVNDAIAVSSGRAIEGFHKGDIDAAIAEVEAELTSERKTKRRLQLGDYASVIESRIADGTITTKAAPLFKAVLNNDINGVFNWIEKNALNSNYRLLARLLKRANINPIIEFGETDTETALAHYDPRYDAVVVDVGNYLQESASAQNMASSILHEVMHSATVNKLGKAFFTITEMRKGWTATQPADRKYVASAEFRAAQNLFNTFDWLATNHPDAFTSKKHYGATNPLELTAEIFVNPTLYKTLADIKLPTNLTQSGSVNALSWVIKKIKQLLGIDAAPDSAVATIMHDTLTLASARKPYNKRIEATAPDIIGLNDLQKKYNAGEEIAYDPQAQAQAQQLNKAMSGTLAQNLRTPVPTASQVAKNIGAEMMKNPTGAFKMFEDMIDKFRVKVVDKNAATATLIQDMHGNAFRDVNQMVRADLLASQANNVTNLTDATFAFGDIGITADGMLQVKDGKYSIENVFKASRKLADRIGVDEMRKLVTNAFYHDRAAVFKAMPKDQWPENWQADPRMVPTDAQIKAGQDAFNQYPELREMREQFIGTKNQMVKFLHDAGFLSDEKAKAFLADNAYAPWMRLKDYQDKASGLGNSGRMVNLSQMKAIVGGTEEVNDMLENMAQMIGWCVRSGTMNYTANRELEELATAGVAQRHKGRPSGNPAHIVMTYEAGKPVYWTVDNPLHLATFQTIKSMNSPAVREVAKWMGRLRASIVLFPAFPVKQVIVDSQRAFMQSGVENPWSMVGKIYKSFLTGEASKGTHQDIEDLKKFGVVGEVDFNTHDTTRGRAAKYGLNAPAESITDKWVNSPAYKFLHNLAYSADLAVRLGIYRQTLEETGDKTLAATRAREIINFQKQGSSEAMQLAKQLIPFLGAYAQGMDVNYRSMIGRGNSMKERRAAAAAYWSNMAVYAGLVTAYTMMMSGDDDYEEQKGYITDRNFLIPGTSFMLPAPPDVGFLGKVIPERITDYLLQEATDDPESAKRLRQGILEAAATGFMPPAAVYGVTPYVELKLNRSFFSDMPIVGQRYQQLEPAMQFSPNTSEFAKSVGAALNESPLQIDYLLKAIGGTTAGSILQMADVVMGNNKMEPEKLPIIGGFQRNTVGGRYQEEYYATRQLADEAYQTATALAESGETEKLQEYVARPEIQARLNARPGIESIHTALSAVSKQRNAIMAQPNLTPEEKRQAVNELMMNVERSLKSMQIRKTRTELE